MGALSVLVEISSNLDIRKHITDLGAVPLLVNLLSDPARSVLINHTTVSVDEDGSSWDQRPWGDVTTT